MNSTHVIDDARQHSGQSLVEMILDRWNRFPVLVGEPTNLSKNLGMVSPDFIFLTWVLIKIVEQWGLAFDRL